MVEHSLTDISTNPRIDQERNSGYVGEEEAGTKGCDVGYDDFDEDNDSRVAYLVEDCTCSEGLDIFAGSFDDRSKDVEEDGEDDDFHTAKDIGNLGGGGLCGGCDDTSQYIWRTG